MSGEIAAWPFNTLESVWRATPKTFDASVTLKPSGSRQFPLMLRPGWDGFFIGMVSNSSLVIIDESDFVHVAGLNPECDPPVPRNRNAPKSSLVPSEWMESVSRQIKVARSNG